MTQKQIFAVRLPAETIADLKGIARTQYLPARTMIRAWIMERLAVEQKNRHKIPVISDVRPSSAPITGEHTTHGVGADVD